MISNAYLALEDGSIFPGASFGADGEAAGEVVFTTSMTGYQEVVTDPSFAGQIVTMTCPHIGNVGVNPEDMESGAPALRGLLVRDYCDLPSNWRSCGSLSAFLRRHGIPALTGVDTRALTRRLRSRGVMRGILTTGRRGPASLVERAQAVPDLSAADWVAQVTTARPFTLGPENGPASPCWTAAPRPTSPPAWPPAAAGSPCCPPRRHCRRSWPCGRRALHLQRPRRPSGGHLHHPDHPPAGGPARGPDAGRLRHLPGAPVAGAGLGGSTYKLKFGHRGCNHPVKDLATGKVSITSQNHGYAVEPARWRAPVCVVTHTSLNDGSVEGLRHRDRCPSSPCSTTRRRRPGPHDSLCLFDRFVESLS